MGEGGATAKDDRAYRSGQVRIFAATWLAYVGYYFCRKAFYVVKADLGTTLGLATTDLAHLGTAYLVSYMIGQFSSAWIGRRLGPKLLLLVGMGLSLICNAAFGAANGFWTVLLFLCLNGLAQGTGWPGCIGSLAFWFRRRRRGTILGVWATCYQVGSVLAGAYAAFLLGAAGWRWSFFGASLMLLAIWLVVLVVHPNRPEDAGLEPLEEDEEEGSPTPTPTPTPTSTKDNQLPATSHQPSAGPPTPAPASTTTKSGWTRQVVWTIVLMGLVYFCIKFLRYALWSWTPFLLRRNFGLEGDSAGYLSTVFDMCGFAGVLVAGYVSDRLFRGRRALVSLVLLAAMAVSFVLMYLVGSTDLLLFTVSIGLVGFTLYGPDSLLSGVGAIDVGSTKGALAAAGIINGMGSIGPVFQEELIGWLYEATGRELLPIVALLVAVAILGAAVMFVLWLRSRAGRANL